MIYIIIIQIKKQRGGIKKEGTERRMFPVPKTKLEL